MSSETICNEMKPDESKVEQAVTAMLTCPRIHDAAALLGVSRTTLWRMAQEPEFQRRLREARLHLSQEIVVSLQANALEAVETLRAVMCETTSPASVRVTAASKLIELSLRAKDQLDLEGRTAALEQALRQREAEKGDK